MKKLLLLLMLTTAVAQAETYQWTDKGGTIHFSDSPTETTQTTYQKIAASTAESGANSTIAPKVEEMKDRMMKDEGIMNQIRSMQNDPDIKAVLSDPAIVRAIQSGDVSTLTSNPAFMKLLSNPGIQDIVNKMQQGQ